MNPLLLPSAGAPTPQSRIILAQVSTPSAGLDWSYTVPNHYALEVTNIHARFLASATVATRSLRILFTSAGNNVTQAVQTSQPTASQDLRQFYGQGVGVSSTITIAGIVYNVLALPRCVLQSGANIQSLTDSIQVGDQWSSIVVQGIAYPLGS